ncbi:MAG: hypothetical protein GWO24_16655, partial [Akkermansiaceae bacterium]|nr:hypothetical protein [Akkermansiaceae bacterium]
MRHAGFEALRKAGAKALPAVQALLEQRNRFVQARAVWLLPFLGDEGAGLAEELLENPRPEVRLLAFRALRNAGRDPLTMIAKLVYDPHPAVRRELAVSLRNAEPLRKTSYVSALLTRCGPDDRTYLEACGLAAEGVEQRVWTSLRTLAKANDPLRWTSPFARVTWRLKTPVAIPSLKERAKSTELTDAARMLAVESLAFIDDPKAAAVLVELARLKGPVGAGAARWLVHLGSTRWKDFDILTLLRMAGLYDPDKVELTKVEVPVFEGNGKLPPVKDILSLKADPAKGKTAAARCIMCHEVAGEGVNFGPSLRRTIANQGEESFLESVVNPSAQVAHGYSGHSIHLKEGGRIDGLVLSHTDPVIVQSQGGLV